MKQLIANLVFFLAFGSQCARSAEQAVFQTVNHLGQTAYRSLVLEIDLVNTPKWVEGTDSPPLSPRQAEMAARSELTRTVRQFDHWELVKFCLRRVGNPENWIYIVEMKPVVQNARASGQVDSIEIVVLLDGRAIRPNEVRGKPRAWRQR